MKYCNEVRSQIESLEERIKDAKKTNKTARKIRKAIPDLCFYVDYEVNISRQCKSMDEVKGILGKLAKVGIMLDNFQKSDANPRWLMKDVNNDNCGVRFAPYWANSGDEGASCRLEQVGTRTEEYPIYKLVCDKGGENEL